jgi:hypothetical protein
MPRGDRDTVRASFPVAAAGPLPPHGRSVNADAERNSENVKIIDDFSGKIQPEIPVNFNYMIFVLGL